MNKYIAVLIIPFGMLLNTAVASEKMTEMVAKRCATEPVVFYGQFSDNRKEILVCKQGTGVSYYAGKLNDTASMNEAIGPRRLKVMFDSGEMKEGLLINAGPEVYAISNQGDENYIFMRMKNKSSKPEVLETDFMDKTTVINNLRQHFMK